MRYFEEAAKKATTKHHTVSFQTPHTPLRVVFSRCSSVSSPAAIYALAASCHIRRLSSSSLLLTPVVLVAWFDYTQACSRPVALSSGRLLNKLECTAAQ